MTTNPAGQPDTLLSVRSLSISFGGIRAVADLSFDVPSGSVVSIIGPNGAGKTTVLNAISGFVPASGAIELDGTNLLRVPAFRRASLGVGRTFQNLQLFGSMTLRDNVLTGAHSALPGNIVRDMLRFPVMREEEHAGERALMILRQVGLASYANRKVEGLPFGVQKLAGVARALANRPRVLLLDEPAAGLNAHEAGQFGDLLLNLRAEIGATILLVEHNMRLVMRMSDHIIVLSEGRKLMEGTPSEVSQDPRVIAAYLGAGENGSTASGAKSEPSQRS